jgi:hypothetical protein
MLKHDSELERYLSEFQPRALRPLEPARIKRGVWMARLAAAAVVVASLGLGLWYGGHKREMARVAGKRTVVRIEFHTTESAVNAISLTKMALDDPKEFELEMNEKSRRVLPGLRGPQSTLSVLAKE